MVTPPASWSTLGGCFRGSVLRDFPSSGRCRSRPAFPSRGLPPSGWLSTHLRRSSPCTRRPSRSQQDRSGLPSLPQLRRPCQRSRRPGIAGISRRSPLGTGAVPDAEDKGRGAVFVHPGRMRRPCVDERLSDLCLTEPGSAQLAVPQKRIGDPVRRLQGRDLSRSCNPSILAEVDPDHREVQLLAPPPLQQRFFHPVRLRSDRIEKHSLGLPPVQYLRSRRRISSPPDPPSCRSAETPCLPLPRRVEASSGREWRPPHPRQLRSTDRSSKYPCQVLLPPHLNRGLHSSMIDAS